LAPWFPAAAPDVYWARKSFGCMQAADRNRAAAWRALESEIIENIPLTRWKAGV
jgi:hypothetical protein